MDIDIVKHQGRYMALESDHTGTRVLRDDRGRTRFDTVEEVEALLDALRAPSEGTSRRSPG